MEGETVKTVPPYVFPSFDIETEEEDEIDYEQDIWIQTMYSIKRRERCLTEDDDCYEQLSIWRLRRLYGSPDELNHNVLTYQSFCGSQEKNRHAYSLCGLVIYKTIRSNKVLFKRDVLSGLYSQSTIIFLFEAGTLEMEVMAILLRLFEEKLPNCCEFFSLDEYATIYNKIQKLYLEKKEAIKDASKTFSEGMTYLKKIMPVEWSEEEHAHLSEKLTDKITDTSHEEAVQMLVSLDAAVNATKETIEKHPSFFLPTLETESGLKAIRVFEDGKKKFLMRQEVDKVLGRESKESEALKTVEYNIDVLRELNKVKDLEFVLTPIIRTHHRAQPIRDSQWKLCKLACDALLEVLKDAIYGFELFQKISEKDWESVDKGFEQLEGYFDLKEETIFFMPLEKINEIPTAKELFSFANDWEVLEVEDVESNGFTAEDLRKELKELELLRLFPDILEHVDAVYKFVLREKEHNKLRTCDLITAVAQCLLISLLRKRPKLADFVHNQNGCRQLAYTSCCSRRSQQYQSTKWSVVQFAESEVLMDKEMGSDRIVYFLAFHQTVLSYSLSNNALATPEKKKTSIFDPPTLLFMADYVEVSQLKCSKGVEHLKNFSTFANYKEKLDKVYLRYISLTATNRDANQMVFMEEVLDMIPYLLKNQKSHLDLDQMKQYKLRLEARRSFQPKVITFDQLAAVLEDFDVDKRQITLVPDIMCAKDCTYTNKFANPSSFLCTLAPSDRWVVDSGEAIYILFSRVVCSIHWKTDDTDVFRDSILEKMTKISMKSEIFSGKNHAQEFTEDPTFIEAQHTALKNFNSRDGRAAIDLKMFLELCEELDLKIKCPEGISKEKASDTFLPVWKARLLIFMEYSILFFEDYHPELLEHVRNGIFQRVPIVSLNSKPDFKQAILTPSLTKLFHPTVPTTATIVAKEKEWVAILTEIWEYSELSKRYGLSESSTDSTTEESAAVDITPEVDMATEELAQVELTAEIPVAEKIQSGFPESWEVARTKKDPGLSPSSESSSSTPPPTARRSRAKMFGELLQMQQGSQDSEEEPPRSRQTPGILRYKYVSKKNKRRIHRRTQKMILCPRKAVTDKAPESNACTNKKCIRMNAFNTQKNERIGLLEMRVKKLKRENKRLERKLDGAGIRKREQKFKDDIKELKEKLSKSEESETQSRKENATLMKALEEQKKQREQEKKAVTSASEQKERVAAKELLEAQAQNTTAHSRIETLEEELVEVKLQLRMTSSTRVMYLELLKAEQDIRLEKPLEEISKQANMIIEKATENRMKEGADYELRKFRREFDEYSKELVEKIRDLREMPERTDIKPMTMKFPEVSNYFVSAYADVVQSGLQRI